MDIKDLKSFLAVAQHRSFLKAAEALGVAQSTVTKQVRKLEAELGRELFERSSRPIQLSAAGVEMLQVVAPLVNSINTLAGGMPPASERSPVVIACAHGFLNEVMLRTVTLFRDSFPQERVRLRLGTKPELVEMVVSGQVHLAITPAPDRLDALSFQPIAASERMLITPLDHPLLRRPLTSVADIAAFPLVLLGHRTQTRVLLEEAFEREGAAYDVAVELDSMEMVKRYIELGMGVGVAYSIALDRGDDRHLGIVSLSQFLPSEMVGVVTAKGARLPAAARDFITLARSTIGAPQFGQHVPAPKRASKS
jgi:LysR family cys regulon transcriptional activator